jgi:hypothetical protein
VEDLRMLNKTQRVLILKWTGVGLLAVSILPVFAHRLFYLPIFQSYLILGIIFGLTYFGYKKYKQIWEW